MKNSKYLKIAVIIMVLLFLITSFLGCSVQNSNSHPRKHSHSHHSKKTPPGQAKKKSGSKSAKAYAPGQQKR
ncbi:hypothetical protein [Flavobacterium piscis]|uniref:Quinol oxidase subunit 4 n=1 Tax=Flavobacterium piscis TaxID=1114874 RepID=A0ABU1YEX9_9FLAO|nr:hypothetical protein [Flavobacterium piscis]MDR7211981.1 hypothetical protein [Flavobacterium piscis]